MNQSTQQDSLQVDLELFNEMQTQIGRQARDPTSGSLWCGAALDYAMVRASCEDTTRTT